MVPVRENSEVVMIYPDIYPDVVIIYYSPLSTITNHWLTNLPRYIFHTNCSVVGGALLDSIGKVKRSARFWSCFSLYAKHLVTSRVYGAFFTIVFMGIKKPTLYLSLFLCI